MLLMAYERDKKTNKEEVWFLDSGCSNQMTGIKDWFIDIDEQFRHSVKLCNGERMLVMEKKEC